MFEKRKFELIICAYLCCMCAQKDAPSPGADLEDMQSLMFLSEDAACHQRSGNLGMALKRYHGLQKVFNEIEDDQYDFHGYSLRRFTVNVYMSYVRLLFSPRGTSLNFELG